MMTMLFVLFLLSSSSSSSSSLSSLTMTAMALSSNTQQQKPRNSNNNNNNINTFSPVTLQEELGCSPTLSALFGPKPNDDKNNMDNDADNNLYYYFDPLNLATDENFARYREAELKHGRLAMLSVVVVAGRNYYMDMILKNEEALYTTTTTTTTAASAVEDLAATVATTTTGISNGGGGGGGGDNTLNIFIPSLYKVLMDDSWSIIDWIGFVVFCGVLEALVYVQISPKDMPGDYGWGYFGERNKGKHERSLLCELENGRLAMISLLIYIVNDLILAYYGGGLSSDGTTGNYFDGGSSSSIINNIMDGLSSIFERWSSS